MTIGSMTPERAKQFLVTPTLTPTASNFFFVANPPKHIGGYKMGNYVFALTRKPSRWHRFWVRVTLGWVWEDASAR